MADSAKGNASRQIRVLDLDVDLDRQTVTRGKQRIDLPELSFRLLATLVRHAPDSVSKDELISEIWGNVVVSDETLAQRVRLLRQALDEDSQAPRYFSSVRGRGYRLLCDVTAKKNESAGMKRFAPIVAALAAAALATLWLFGGAADKPDLRPPATSIAVLPFADISPEQDYGHYADGMQEELLALLTHVPGLQVSSRTSVEPYRVSSLSVPDIAAALGVNAIIEGSVRVDVDRIRITVQLIDGQTDKHRWADSFERTLSVQNIFAIQEEVARQIANALQLEYANSTEPDPVSLPTSSLDAYSAYLLGRHHTFRLTRDDLQLAVKFLQQATALDPEFAEAFASLGWAYSFLGTNYGNMLPSDAYPKAKEAALRALALDAGLSDARELYAAILTWYDWDFEAAEREYRKTLEIDPSYVLGYALFLSTQQRHNEALELIERALQGNPGDGYVRINAAWRYFSARQYDRAIAEAQRASEHADSLAVLGLASLATRDIPRAIAALEADVQEQGRQPMQLSNLAIAYYAAGRHPEADVLVEELEAMAQEVFISPTLLADAYFASGDADRGFASLREAVAARTRDVLFLPTNRLLDDWRDDPRYQALMREIGFPSNTTPAEASTDGSRLEMH